MAKYSKLEDGTILTVKKSNQISKKIKLIAIAAISFVTLGLLCSFFFMKDPVIKQGYIDNTEHRFNDTIGKYTFMTHMQRYPFDKALEAIKSGNEAEIAGYRSLILDYLFEFNRQTPSVIPDLSCKKPVFKATCSEPIFNGKRDSPAKIGLLIQFGFEVDTLLIILHQYRDLVDKIFILESTRTHFKNTKKPLVWERLKYSPEFLPFSDMVVHLVVDDAPLAAASDDMWQMERYQEHQRWNKFVEWNNDTKYFTDSDLLGFGDTDEVPSLKVLTELKNCKFRDDIFVVDVGIWFPMGTIYQAFRTDFPVEFTLPYTLGDPTFYTLAGAMKGGVPSRQRGTSAHHILGGMHMSNYCYLPTILLKDMTCTECGMFDKDNLQLMKERFFSNDSQVIQKWQQERCDVSHWGTRIIDVQQLDNNNQQAVSVPWYLECNKGMFPSWEHLPDSRLL
ncbi:hypothetical protein HDV04_001249 [Boothiomyces sp. JEL0838]|nr:hypothetical protein HDV04_001249 [Boothiomyces sp. JEL0838]